MRALLQLSMMGALGLVSVLQAEPPRKNSTTVVMSSGPFAGSYTVENQGCIKLKERDLFGVTFKKFAHSPTTKTLEEAAIQVDRDSASGQPKTGDVTVQFLAVGSNEPTDYSLSNVPLTVLHVGQGGQLTFDGNTKDGVHMRVTATCDRTEAV